MKTKTPSILGKIYVMILVTIFGGIVLHAPMSVGLGVLFPQVSLVMKAWKEILLIIAGILAIILMHQNRRFDILRRPIMIAVELFGLWHLILLFWQPTGLLSAIAGLIIDLRYILFFGLMYIAMNLYPDYKRLFVKVGLIGALVVLIFGLLQVFVLPADILKYVGYGKDTIAPYLTVDMNQAYVRINSTLRGPNPLGAYTGIVLALTLAAIIKGKLKNNNRQVATVAILIIGGLVSLWASYSRSALIGAIVALLMVFFVGISDKKKLFTKSTVIAGAAVVIVGGLVAISNQQFISNVILHDNPTTGASVDSNSDHVKSLNDGIKRVINQPLGSGIGSTGSASLLSDSPIIIENQYLMTAHEAGWIGLGLFMYIFGLIIYGLWQRRSNWLALGVLASGIGLAIIGLFLPVWADDTVSLIWWGLAALALSRE